MSLKSAAFLALIGMSLLTVLSAADLITNAVGVSGGYVPAMALLRSLVQIFANLTLTIFLYVFYNRQS
jgi:hypothetical protein